MVYIDSGLMVNIRGLVAHFPAADKSEREYLENCFELCGDLSEFIEGSGLKVMTSRVVFPMVSKLTFLKPENLGGFCRLVEDYLDDFKIDIAAIPLVDRYFSVIHEVLAETEKIYLSIGLGEYNSPDDLRVDSAVDLLERIARKGVLMNFARLAFGYGEIPVSPYFPLTKSVEAGMSLSLLYASSLLSQVRSGLSLEEAPDSILMKSNKLGEAVSNFLGLKFLGLDASISPWKENSVAEFIEELTGVEFGFPGTHSVIWRLNQILWSKSKLFKLTGFNEVMLPLAEDNRLKELVFEGKLRLRDFISMLSVCVVGLDMIPIPAEIGKEELKKILLDAFVQGSVKGKPLGIRLILADGKPGDKVDLGIFGDTPIPEF